MKTLSYLLLSVLFSTPALAKDFETFDGHTYNGLYYPLIDIIEWGEQDKELPHLEFHVHQKEKVVDLAGVAGTKGGRPVLWIMYDLGYRGEHVCRHVLAPAQFKEGQKLYFYRDNSDADYDNIFVYSEPLKQKESLNLFLKIRLVFILVGLRYTTILILEITEPIFLEIF
jgi:hypothetical protein